MLNVYYFTTTGWGGTGDLTAPVEQNTLWGTALVRRGLTLDQCYNACNPTEDDPVVISPDPDAAEFRDAAGFRKHTVKVSLGANFSFNKSGVTLAGGAYRLRLDGGGTRYVHFSATSTIIDVDFCNMTYPKNSPIAGFSPCEFDRCLFANISLQWHRPFTQNISNTFRDCSFIGFLCNTQYSVIISVGGSFTRCLVYGIVNTYTNTDGTNDALYAATVRDCVLLKNVAGSKPSEHCVAPPPDDPLDVTDWSKWEEWDFRLKPDSSYATGNSLTSADGVVYDLAGNKRKVGGAKGAYEYLSDVTLYDVKPYGNNVIIVTRDDESAPELIAASETLRDKSSYNVPRKSLLFSGATRYKISSSGAWSTINENGYVTSQTWAPDISADTGDGTAVCKVEFKARSSVSGTYREQLNIFNKYSFQTSNGGIPSVQSLDAEVCLIRNSSLWADTGATVKEIIVPGWTHVDVGDVTAKIKLGLGATVRSSGKLTLENETTASAELLRRIQLRAPALLTLKDCDVSD